jgi:hypothetical protein
MAGVVATGVALPFGQVRHFHPLRWAPHCDLKVIEVLHSRDKSNSIFRRINHFPPAIPESPQSPCQNDASNALPTPNPIPVLKREASRPRTSPAQDQLQKMYFAKQTEPNIGQLPGSPSPTPNPICLDFDHETGPLYPRSN